LWENEEFKALIKKDQDEKAAIRAQIEEMEERGILICKLRKNADLLSSCALSNG
jgi:Spy/CpxP family protein refolding chaperone